MTASLVCHGKRFDIAKEATAKLEIFTGNPALLDRPYNVSSNVSLDTFETFVSAVAGNHVIINANNYTGLVLLCNELGFRGLDESIANCRPSDAEDVALAGQRRVVLIEKTFTITKKE